MSFVKGSQENCVRRDCHGRCQAQTPSRQQVGCVFKRDRLGKRQMSPVIDKAAGTGVLRFPREMSARDTVICLPPESGQREIEALI